MADAVEHSGCEFRSTGGATIQNDPVRMRRRRGGGNLNHRTGKASGGPELLQGIQQDGSRWGSAIPLLWWIVACVVAFLPFAHDTSAWDAVRLHVPGNQGNWWHLLAGAPFFLAFPMIWIRLRSLYASEPMSRIARRVLWTLAGLSMIGTLLVESPFLLHLAGTSDWQRFAVLGLGLGILIASVLTLTLRYRRMSPRRACIAALATAYLANASLCLVVYSGATGSLNTRSGWLVTMILVWPMAGELGWMLTGPALTSAGVQPREVSR
jgi:hypothetical protein